MSATLYPLVVTLTYANSAATFAATEAVANVVVTVTGTATGNTTPVSQTVAPGTTSVIFSVAADSYTGTAQAFDANGNALGTALSGTGAVTAPPPPALISLSLPATIALS